MSVTRSSQKDVSVEQVDDKTVAAEFDLLFEVEVGLADAIRDGLKLLFEAVEADETSVEESVDGYAYRQVAAHQSGLAYVEQEDGVDSDADIYEEVFDQLEETAASHRESTDTKPTPGVIFNPNLTGCPAGQLSQKKAEMHRLERETDRLINGAWGGQEGAIPEGKALITEERIAAREWELERIRKQAAGGFQQDGRGRRTREKVLAEHRARKKEREQRVIGSYCEIAPEHDPRHQLGKTDPELLGEVNRTAARMAEKYNAHRPGIARRIAARVSSGTTGAVVSAAMTVRDSLLEDETIVRPISEVDPEVDRVSVSGTITTLYYPNSPTQYQVGVLEDDSGETAKVTVWKRSDPHVTLREGDHVCLQRVSPGKYRGQKTLAVRHDTLIIVREEGDGPAKRGCHPNEHNPTPQNVNRKRTSGTGDPVPRPVASRYQQFEKTVFTAELVPDSFHDWVDSHPGAETVETKEGEKAYAITTRRRYPNYSPGKAKEKEREERERLRWKNISYEPEWHERIRRVDDEKYINRHYLRAGQGWGPIDWDLPWPGQSDERIPR